MLVHLLDGFFRDFARGPFIAEEGSGTVSHGRRHAAQRQNGGHAAHGVCASTEAEQEDVIAGLPQPQDRSVAVDYIHRYPKPCRLAYEVVDPAIGAGEEKYAAGRLRSQTRVVERQLFARINVQYCLRSRRA